MAKPKDKRSTKAEHQHEGGASVIRADKIAFDPTLTSLFASSSGPVQAPPKSRYQERIQRHRAENPGPEENDTELTSLPANHSENDSEDDSRDEETDGETDEEGSAAGLSESESTHARLNKEAFNGTQEKNKKRKRGDREEIEDTYMRKLAREEEKEAAQRQKKRKTKEAKEEDNEDTSDHDDASSKSEGANEDRTIPQHESLAQQDNKDAPEIEKAARTVFLGNVSTECIDSKGAEKLLKRHLESFIADLADNKPPHKIESIRFRSTAFASALPKRAAFAKKEIMDSTTKSTNAYAVYTTKVAAREAVKRLNGTVLLNRHLHVDSVAHPTKVDHRRCVFVGNLPFVDDESQTATADGEKPKKNKPASDVEEGLWVHFAKAGKIESVRVVRDAQTRVGKGFAYVQFIDENGVEAALQLDEKKFPPMLPRKLRVTRCKAEKKKDKPRGPPPSKVPGANRKGGYIAKMTEEQKSMQGRARSMLGKVAKAHSKEGFVFEGHRASEKQGKSGLKFKGSGGGKKKGPNGRKSRSASWKKTGGKK